MILMIIAENLILYFSLKLSFTKILNTNKPSVFVIFTPVKKAAFKILDRPENKFIAVSSIT